MSILAPYAAFSETGFTYMTADGDIVEVTGTGFTYDIVTGLALTGTIASMQLTDIDLLGGPSTVTTITGMASIWPIWKAPLAPACGTKPRPSTPCRASTRRRCAPSSARA